MNWVDMKHITETLSSTALVLHKNYNLIISRRCLRKSDKEMYQNEKRPCGACKTIAFVSFNMQICGVFRYRGRRCLVPNRETPLENVTLRNFYYFAIIPIRSTCTPWAEYVGSTFMETEFK